MYTFDVARQRHLMIESPSQTEQSPRWHIFLQRCSELPFVTSEKIYRKQIQSLLWAVAKPARRFAMLCKFQIIIIIHFFRNSLFLQCANWEIFA